VIERYVETVYECVCMCVCFNFFPVATAVVDVVSTFWIALEHRCVVTMLVIGSEAMWPINAVLYIEPLIDFSIVQKRSHL